MREIKFRAWNKTNHSMVYANLNQAMNTLFYSWIDTDNIMQYTGLKDRNGKEIYEGDIVKFKYIHTKGIIQAIVKYDNFLTSFKFDMGDDGHFRNSVEISDLEVIGNIYENPELMEVVNS